MGTAVLLPSDDASSIIRSDRNPNKSSRKKLSTAAVNSSSLDRNCSVVKHPGSNLVMGQVKILKRGEKLIPDDNATNKSDDCYDLVLGSTNRIGPDPLIVKKQVRVQDLTDGLYAGPTSVASPPPSSVPVPEFLGRKTDSVSGDLKRFLCLIS
ncbi:uncharacterized protein [Cicer arietinum]|uniref:Uncharacterized protein LOC101497240 n=1 Tax=Cicer arietinum TaxID=3827 RepID=A0A1S2XGB9_CICAR|nr:uncharacterized protein LOC101497240 [Cicer arietinum]